MNNPDRKTPLTIGLTGGIGSGKSTVAELFQQQDIQVIDADHIARELVQPGSVLLEKISEVFGKQIIDPDGALDRKQLRQLIFSDQDKRRQLEALLHPGIYERITSLIEQAASPYVIVMIPLLVETGRADWLDRVLVVDIAEKDQIERIQSRDGLSVQEIRDIMATQSTRDERLLAADDVIVNDGIKNGLNVTVMDLHRKYLELAGAICE